MPSLVCHGCNKAFGIVVDSDAHIIPNALGGRLAPKGIICTGCNNQLDEAADNKLVVAFGPWPTLIDVPRQRGTNPAVTVSDDHGNEYRVEADGRRTIARPTYEKREIKDGHLVEIRAPIQKQADQLIGRLVKEFPQVTASEARSHAKVVSRRLEHPWKIQTNFAPNQVFPGIFAGLWLFHIHVLGFPFCPWATLRAALEEGTLVSRLRYMPNGFPGLDGPHIPIAHKIVLRADRTKRILIGYVEVLGVLRVGGILAENYDGEADHLYVADVMQAADKTAKFTINTEIFSQTDWSKEGFAFPADQAKITVRLKQALSVLQDMFNKREQDTPTRTSAHSS